MILPNKVIKISDSLLYKSLQYFKRSKKIKIASKKDIEYLTILYALGYVNYNIVQKKDVKGDMCSEIEIIKIR